MTLTERERETYVTAWSLEAYRSHSPGEMYLPLFLDMAKPASDASILDAGCGAGLGALALRRAGFWNLHLCDLTDAGLTPEAQALSSFSSVCLWETIAPQLGHMVSEAFDWVYCCDVLEHVPTPFTMLVVSRLLEVARQGVFLSISLMPDQFGAWVGKPLHQTVQPFLVWQEQLNTVGRIRESRDMLHVGIFLVEPK